MDRSRVGDGSRKRSAQEARLPGSPGAEGNELETAGDDDTILILDGTAVCRTPTDVLTGTVVDESRKRSAQQAGLLAEEGEDRVAARGPPSANDEPVLASEVSASPERLLADPQMLTIVEENAQIRAMFQLGVSVADISREVRRGTATVARRLEVMGLLAESTLGQRKGPRGRARATLERRLKGLPAAASTQPISALQIGALAAALWTGAKASALEPSLSDAGASSDVTTLAAASLAGETATAAEPSLSAAGVPSAEASTPAEASSSAALPISALPINALAAALWTGARALCVEVAGPSLLEAAPSPTSAVASSAETSTTAEASSSAETSTAAEASSSSPGVSAPPDEPLTEAEAMMAENALIEVMFDQGASKTVIASAVGKCEKTVGTRARSMGLSFRDRGRAGQRAPRGPAEASSSAETSTTAEASSSSAGVSGPPDEPLTEAEAMMAENALVEVMFEQGALKTVIASAIGKCEKTVGIWARSMGLSFRERAGERAPQGPHEDALIRDLFENGTSRIDIAEAAGMPVRSIHKRLVGLGHLLPGLVEGRTYPRVGMVTFFLRGHGRASTAQGGEEKEGALMGDLCEQGAQPREIPVGSHPETAASELDAPASRLTQLHEPLNAPPSAASHSMPAGTLRPQLFRGSCAALPGDALASASRELSAVFSISTGASTTAEASVLATEAASSTAEVGTPAAASLSSAAESLSSAEASTSTAETASFAEAGMPAEVLSSAVEASTVAEASALAAEALLEEASTPAAQRLRDYHATRAVENALMRDMHEKGASRSEIAVAVGKGEGTVSARLLKIGLVAVRPDGQNTDENVLIRDMFLQGASRLEIMHAVGRGQKTVTSRLVKMGFIYSGFGSMVNPNPRTYSGEWAVTLTLRGYDRTSAGQREVAEESGQVGDLLESGGQQIEGGAPVSRDPETEASDSAAPANCLTRQLDEPHLATAPSNATAEASASREPSAEKMASSAVVSTPSEASAPAAEAPAPFLAASTPTAASSVLEEASFSAATSSPAVASTSPAVVSAFSSFITRLCLFAASASSSLAEASFSAPASTPAVASTSSAGVSASCSASSAAAGASSSLTEASFSAPASTPAVASTSSAGGSASSSASSASASASSSLAEVSFSAASTPAIALTLSVGVPASSSASSSPASASSSVAEGSLFSAEAPLAAAAAAPLSDFSALLVQPLDELWQDLADGDDPADEDATILDLFEQGASYSAIGRAVGMTAGRANQRHLELVAAAAWPCYVEASEILAAEALAAAAEANAPPPQPLSKYRVKFAEDNAVIRGMYERGERSDAIARAVSIQKSTVSARIKGMGLPRRSRLFSGPRGSGALASWSYDTSSEAWTLSALASSDEASSSADASSESSAAAPPAAEDWVQCDSCDKWRRVPCTVGPGHRWVCSENADPTQNSCEFPEPDPDLSADVWFVERLLAERKPRAGRNQFKVLYIRIDLDGYRSIWI